MSNALQRDVMCACVQVSQCKSEHASVWPTPVFVYCRNAVRLTETETKQKPCSVLWGELSASSHGPNWINMNTELENSDKKEEEGVEEGEKKRKSLNKDLNEKSETFECPLAVKAGNKEKLCNNQLLHQLLLSFVWEMKR